MTDAKTAIPGAAEPVSRVREIEDPTNLYFIHPIAAWLTPRFARLGISPNQVSLSGMVFGLLAGVAYAHYKIPIFSLAGFVFMILWHIMDGADGQLARLTNSQSEIGKIIDGICDYVTFIAVYLALGFAMNAEFGAYIWIFVIAAGLCHAIQAAAYEVQRQEFNYWGHQRESCKLPDLHSVQKSTSQARFGGPLNSLYAVYVKMQYRFSGTTTSGRQNLAASIASYPESSEAIRRKYREVFAPPLRFWALMSANYRTIGIFIFCILKIPILYFLLEIFLLTPLLFVFVRRQANRNEAFIKQVAATCG